MTEATPRPWEMRPAQIGQTVDADGNRDFGIGAVIGDQNYCIAEALWRVDQLTFAPAEANADLILRAVNNFDALVSALEKIDKYLAECGIDDDAKCDHSAGGICYCDYLAIRREMDAALAAAREAGL